MNSETAAESDFVMVHPDIFEYPVDKEKEPCLMGNRCRKCGRVFFPKRAFCRFCHEKEPMEDITLGSRGTVYASTVVHIDSPTGVKAPYAFGYVDVQDNDYRVFALFAGEDPASFTPGTQVELVIGPVAVNRQEKKVIGYRYRLAGKEGAR